MAIPTDLVGRAAQTMIHTVDERWIMAFAAALGQTLPCYFDTTAADGIVAHPLFVVCPEWPVIVAGRDDSITHGLTAAEVRTSVHAGHDTVIHRLVRPGDELTTTMETVGLVNIGPGAMSTTRLTTTDGDGQLVATTTQTGIYLGVPAVGPDQPDQDPSPQPPTAERVGQPTVTTVAIPAGAAHTYTECARIWNPIHTDRAVALAAGLPDIILHGTANLAHGVSAVVAERAGNRPELVRRIGGRFAAMVRLPSELTIRVWPDRDLNARSGHTAVPFEVLNGDGEPAVKDGLVVLGPPET